jgi:hypothetical protein
LLSAHHRRGVFQKLPSAFAINMVMFLNTIALLTTCFDYSRPLRCRKADDLQLCDPLGSTPDMNKYIPRRRMASFALLSLAGVLICFRRIPAVVAYFNDPAHHRDNLLDASFTWRALAVLMKPFLGFAVVMAWCGSIDSNGMNASMLRRAVASMFMLVGVILSFGTISSGTAFVCISRVGSDRIGVGILPVFLGGERWTLPFWKTEVSKSSAAITCRPRRPQSGIAGVRRKVKGIPC